MPKDREKLCFACPASYPAGYSSCPRCQLPLVFPTIGRVWVVEGLIGRGGMGAVFAAHHMNDASRKAAVKVLVPVPGEQMSERRDRIGRFHREALALRRLVHENIVQLYDFARERDGSLYLAMERLDGPTLSTLLKREGRLPIQRAVELILPVLSAIEAAHKVGVIHRDLKPDNIVLANVVTGAIKKQEIKVVDFGVARLAGDSFTRTGQALGTPLYMPPEQANGADIDERVDIYGAGAVFYELITGRSPFSAPDGPNANLAVLAMVLTSEPRPPRELEGSISPALEAVVMRALRRNREDRFPSVAAFSAAIVEAVQHPTVVGWTPPPQRERALPKTPSLPSLANDSLPGPGGAGLFQAGHLASLPRWTSASQPSAPQFGPPQTPPEGTSLLIKMLVAGLYTIMVGLIGISLLIDRVGGTGSGRMGSGEQPGQAASQSALPQERGSPPSLASVTPEKTDPAAMKARTCPEDMVLVPAGCFMMGSDNMNADQDERPAHEVCLSRPYCVDRHEVDNASYQACVKKGRCRALRRDFRRLKRADFTGERQPVVMVSWRDANAYCQAQGRRLPTEAEWERAARGDDNLSFPWGNEEPSCEIAAIGAYAFACAEPDRWCREASRCLGKNPSHPVPPGSFRRDRSPFGVMDMGGNVSEWVADWYSERYYAESPKQDPAGPETGTERVYRGGSWGQMGTYVRATFRNRMAPSAPGDIGLGFRCARHLD